jgi:hypothetical protein
MAKGDREEVYFIYRKEALIVKWRLANKSGTKTHASIKCS